MTEYTIGFPDHRAMEFSGAVVLCSDDDRAEDEANELVAAAQHRWCARIALHNKATDRRWTIDGPLQAERCPNCHRADCESWKLERDRSLPMLRAYLTAGDETTELESVVPSVHIRRAVSLLITLDLDEAVNLARALLNAASYSEEDGEAICAVTVEGFLQVSTQLDDDDQEDELPPGVPLLQSAVDVLVKQAKQHVQQVEQLCSEPSFHGSGPVDAA